MVKPGRLKGADGGTIPAAKQGGQGYYDVNNGDFRALVSLSLPSTALQKEPLFGLNRACYNYLAAVEVTD
jgi:hypothetical protein